MEDGDADPLWSKARVNFETNDGSLPTVEIRSLTAEEVAGLYAWIRSQSHLASENTTFWDFDAEQDRPVDDVPNAAALVPSGRAAPFHFAVEGIQADGATIPCLGVHVFQETLAIDYRMGPEWSSENVRAFYRWLHSAVARTQHGVLVPADGEAPPEPELFMAMWNAILAEEG